MLIAGGGLLIIGAVRNVHPWAPLVQAFGGTPPPPPGQASHEALTSALAGAGSPSSGSGPVASAAGAAGAALAIPGDATAATGILAAGGWPATADNVAGLNAWIACEKPAGQPMQWNNPLNTAQDHGQGGHPPPGYFVLEFPTPAAGFRANAMTIQQTNFTAIASALKAGRLGSAIKMSGGSVLGNWGTNPACVASRLATLRPSIPPGARNWRAPLVGARG